MTSLEVIALEGVPFIKPGDDLVELIASALKRNEVEPQFDLRLLRFAQNRRAPYRLHPSKLRGRRVAPFERRPRPPRGPRVGRLRPN